MLTGRRFVGSILPPILKRCHYLHLLSAAETPPDLLRCRQYIREGDCVLDLGANIGAYSGVHQFCRVGKEAYIGGYSVVVKDALPFALTVGNHAKCYGLNITGMKRRGYSRAAIDALHHAFHLLLSAKLNTTQAVERINQEISDSPEVSDLLRFIEGSSRGVTK